jgi:superfamily II DNA or RNA helicase
MHVELTQRAAVSDTTPQQRRNIKRALTRPNPKFYELQKMSKWTGTTPRELKLYEQVGDVLYTPRAYDLNGIATAPFTVTDRTVAPVANSTWPFNGDKRNYQTEAWSAAMQCGSGILIAPTGAGKTAIACRIIASRGLKTAVVVHTKELLAQWQKALRFFLGVEAGVVGGGKFKVDADIILMMIQSATKRAAQLPPFGLVVLDECHRAPALSYMRLLETMSPARYRLGFSATPWRRDNLQILLRLHVGPTIWKFSRKQAESIGAILVARARSERPPWFRRLCRKKLSELSREPTDAEVLGEVEWIFVVSHILEQDSRTLSVLNGMLARQHTGRVVLLTDRVAHVERVQSLLMQRCAVPEEDISVLHGQMAKRLREEMFERTSRGCAFTIATLALIGEGVDVPGWQHLYLLAPSSSKSPRVVQAIGRVVRPAPGKTHADVYDVVDGYSMTRAAWSGRQALFKKQGLEVR